MNEDLIDSQCLPRAIGFNDNGIDTLSQSNTRLEERVVMGDDKPMSHTSDMTLETDTELARRPNLHDKKESPMLLNEQTLYSSMGISKARERCSSMVNFTDYCN